MSPSTPALVVEDGVRARVGLVGGFEVSDLWFAPGFEHAPFEPEVPYVGVVLAGALEKRFGRSTWELVQGDSFAMPDGAQHSARFGYAGARVVVVRVHPGAAGGATALLRRLRRYRRPRTPALAGRIAAELATGERAWPLAVEGLAFELLAEFARDRARSGRAARRPGWLARAAELLEPGSPNSTALGDVAAAIGVHPSHLARVFRAEYGMSVGEYARARRLDWAAAQLAEGDLPLAVIARQAGFCDQSHFTRAFARHIGLTPGRYRQQAARGQVPPAAGLSPELDPRRSP
jgi:AraC family transcriptional regulator